MPARIPHEIEHRFADVLLVLARVEDRYRQLLEQLPALLVPEVLSAGTMTIDAAGGAETFFRAGYEAVCVANPSAAPVTLSLTSRQQEAPVTGQGVFVVPPGSWALVPATGQALTLYGTAGAALPIVVLSKPCPPAFGRLLT